MICPLPRASVPSIARRLMALLMAEMELTLVAVVGPKTPLKILSTRRGYLGAGGIG